MTTHAPQRYFASPALYDLMYATTRADIPFHVELARQARGPVLEIACGNGRVLIPCVEAGVEMDGLDQDEEMLQDARRKLAAAGLSARLTCDDMRRFILPRRYALITVPFSSFLHNLTQQDQLATLYSCREHLEPGGRLVMAMFSPDPRRLVEHDGAARVILEHPHPSAPGTVRVLDAMLSDPVEQISRVRRTVELLDDAGERLETHVMEFGMRWIWPAEMELLLQAAGFHRCAAQGRTGYRDGFQPKAAVEPRDVMVWTAWKD